MIEFPHGFAAGPSASHIEIVDYTGRAEDGVWANDRWPLLSTPARSGISNAIQDVLNSFNDASRSNSSAAERRAQSPLRVTQIEWWGRSTWIGPPVLASSRHGRAEFALRGLSIGPQWRRGLWMQFVVASPRFAVPQLLERRQISMATKNERVVAAGDLAVEMLSRTRILDASCLARRDTPEVAVDAVRLLHQIAYAANTAELPAAAQTTDAARRLFDAGYEEYELRSATWADTAGPARGHGSGSHQPAPTLPTPPPAMLDMVTDTLAGLTQAYRDLRHPE